MLVKHGGTSCTLGIKAVGAAHLKMHSKLQQCEVAKSSVYLRPGSHV